MPIWQGGNVNRMWIHQQAVETPHGTAATALALPDEREGRNLIAFTFLYFHPFPDWTSPSKVSQPL